ncbi:unnamed protein product [Owenia fusiformis]|uniref:Uncharacterized protein n=1 Tax=Owenia fusiformis TaxID=6347 RepID=A0A8J1TY91_OWEFU|nr:unnamed protein product [Owenia fusiformis]
MAKDSVDVDGIMMAEYDGIYWPRFWPRSRPPKSNMNWEEWHREVQKMPCREDDVWTVTFPKAGLHWSSQILHMLMTGDTEVRNAETHFFDMNTPAETTAQSSPRLIQTHMPINYMPKDVWSKKSKILVILRNPKDQLVSFYHHIRSSERMQAGDEGINRFYQRFADKKLGYGDFFDFYDLWWKKSKTCDHVKLVTYEQLKKEFIKTVRDISEFLGKPQTDDFLEKMAHVCSIENMQKNKEILDSPGIWKDQKGTMYRKGQVGDWKNHFTVATNEQFDKIIQERVNKDWDFKIIYE